MGYNPLYSLLNDDEDYRRRQQEMLQGIVGLSPNRVGEQPPPVTPPPAADADPDQLAIGQAIQQYQGLLGSSNPEYEALNAKHLGLEDRALDDAANGGDYSVWKGIRDLAPSVIGSLSVLLAPKGARAGAAASVAQSGIQHIENMDKRDQSILEANRNLALAESARRDRGKGDKLGQLGHYITSLQTQNQQKLYGRSLESREEKLKQEAMRTAQQIEKDDPNSDRNLTLKAAYNDSLRRQGIKDREGNLVQVPDGVHPEQWLKDPTVDPTVKLALQPLADALAVKRAGAEAAASGYGSEVGHAKGEAATADLTINTTNKVREGTGGMSDADKLKEEQRKGSVVSESILRKGDAILNGPRDNNGELVGFGRGEQFMGDKLGGLGLSDDASNAQAKMFSVISDVIKEKSGLAASEGEVKRIIKQIMGGAGATAQQRENNLRSWLRDQAVDADAKYPRAPKPQPSGGKSSGWGKYGL